MLFYNKKQDHGGFIKHKQENIRNAADTHPSRSFPIVVVIHSYTFAANAKPPQNSTLVL